MPEFPGALSGNRAALCGTAGPLSQGHVRRGKVTIQGKHQSKDEATHLEQGKVIRAGQADEHDEAGLMRNRPALPLLAQS